MHNETQTHHPTTPSMINRPTDLVSWARFILIILNISGLFIGLMFLGAAIFLLIDKGDLLTDVMFLELAEPACILVIVCSLAVIFFTASNLLGVLSGIKWLLITNIVLHAIVGVLCLIAAVFAIICVINNTDWIRQAMRESLQKRYGVDVGNNTLNTYETKMWDIAQQRWYCCGVEDNNWGVYRASTWYDLQPGSKDYTRPMVPVSCCVTNQYGRIVDVQKCQSWLNGPPKMSSGIYNEAIYYTGCYKHGLDVLNQVSKGIVAMGFIMALIQFGAAFCGIVIVLSMRKTQKPLIKVSRSGTSMGGGSIIYEPSVGDFD